MLQQESSISKSKVQKEAKTYFFDQIALAEVIETAITCPVEEDCVETLRLTLGRNILFLHPEKKECKLEVEKNAFRYGDFYICASDKEGTLLINDKNIPIPFSEIVSNYEYNPLGHFELS